MIKSYCTDIYKRRVAPLHRFVALDVHEPITMIYGFYLNRFHCPSLSAASKYVAVIDEQQKTLQISSQNEANPFPGQTMPLEAISGVSLADTSCSMLLNLDTSTTHSAPGRPPQMFIEFQHTSDRLSFLNILQRETSQARELRVEEYAS